MHLHRLRGVFWLGLIWALGSQAWCAISAEELEETKAAFLAGQYSTCEKNAETALENYGNKEEWQLVLIRSLMAQGKYPKALGITTNALSRNSWSVRLRWLAREVFLANGDTANASRMVDVIIDTVSAQPRAYREPQDLVAFGQAALLKGADPKRVLDTVYESARKANPKLREVYLAAGELALSRHDYKLAARKFEEGLKKLPEDPDLHFGIARSYSPNDAEVTRASLTAVLNCNTNHAGSLLLLVDRGIDAEDYQQASALLDSIQSFNPSHPDVWAYRAVLAHFLNRPDEAKEARLAGLKHWSTNPRVDHLIGLKLSQHYRFAEGADFQRQALTFDPDYLPARAQLAQDLLRLGEEREGWMLADRVHRDDAYDIQAYNLTTLHDTLRKFVTLTNADFIVRMNPHEAAVYGPRVLELLGRVRRKLSAKYDIEPRRPTLVEIFNEQKDFEVRTFGMPGNPGYLGVCFGSVITANSPAVHAGKAVNWEAVLWHEFAHVITLQLTGNKMPRWLSEGISVHEELEANPAWGQRMGPKYRQKILDGDLTPVSKLSAAFLQPDDLQFAYYQSALVVEFILKRFGLDKLKSVLKSLGEGAEINAAIQKHTMPIAGLDSEFESYARDKALRMAPGLDWSLPPGQELDARADTEMPAPRRPRATVADALSAQNFDWDEWAKARPTNYYVMQRNAARLMEKREWGAARPILETLVSLYPESAGAGSAYRMLAAACQGLGDTNAEVRVLKKFAEVDAEAIDAYSRLMSLCGERGDWETVQTSAQRYLAVNPLVPEPYRSLAEASEKLEDWTSAIHARRTLLHLNPSDRAEAHFRLAQLLHQVGDSEAREQVLMALEEAPRYRAALALLLRISEGQKQTSLGTASPGQTPSMP